jgi:hypothetical protein
VVDLGQEEAYAVGEAETKAGQDFVPGRNPDGAAIIIGGRKGVALPLGGEFGYPSVSTSFIRKKPPSYGVPTACDCGKGKWDMQDALRMLPGRRRTWAGDFRVDLRQALLVIGDELDTLQRDLVELVQLSRDPHQYLR